MDENAGSGCYCGLWTTQPEVLASQGLPRGYCGHCEVCGQPGHTRHFPGTSPCTGAWCDRHYRRVAWLHPLGHHGRRIYPALLVLALAAFVLWRG